MASAKKCDRCGRLYEEYNVDRSKNKHNSFHFLNTDYKRSYYTSDIVELCPDCMAELRNWIDEKKDKKTF